MTEEPGDVSPTEVHSVQIGPMTFITAWAEHHRAGDRSSQTARRQRKVTSLPLHHSDKRHPADVVAGVAHRWRSVTCIRHMSWWIAIAFMLGASGFILGCVAAQWPAALPDQLVQPRAIAWTFVLGALFFTLAALLQWIQSMQNGLEAGFSAGRSFRLWRSCDLGYWASLIQLAGTLLFNLNTIDALIVGLSPAKQDVLIWTPNLLGSICFLVASQLAAMEYAHGWFRYAPRELSWWIVYLNLLGSSLFALSVVGSIVLPGGSVLAPELANLSTLAGAVCFLIAAYLLIPEAQERINN